MKCIFMNLCAFVSIVIVGVAHRNNPVTQRKIAEEEAIPTLVQVMMHPPSQDIQVQKSTAIHNNMKLMDLRSYSK